ncbi:hypothetical protein [Microbacterium sp. PA5]|uniref:hypothetical protein n=1 Tax=Microbacterium sp. PA5 TaxID=3416654 RepID=UPI003CFAD9F2
MRGVRALWRASIWHPDAIPADEGEIARDVKRYLLPVIDILMIIGAFRGIHGGMPTFALVFNDTASYVGALAVLVFAAGCLLGVSFPALWVLELVSKCGLGFILATYGVLLMVAAAGEYPARGIVAGTSSGLATVVVWRVFWLTREWRRRRDATQRATEGRA